MGNPHNHFSEVTTLQILTQRPRAVMWRCKCIKYLPFRWLLCQRWGLLRGQSLEKKNTLLCVEKSAEAEVAYDGCFADRTGTPLPADVKSQDGTSNRPDGMIILWANRSIPNDSAARWFATFGLIWVPGVVLWTWKERSRFRSRRRQL